MISFLFWISALVVVYAYLGYPLWVWWASRLHPRGWKQAEIYPTVSIVMAVHNGGILLRDKIHHLLNLDYPSELLEVVVASDGSSDDTNEILASIDDSRLISIICPQHLGKANALNHAVGRATGEIVLFVDLRPKLEKEALRQIVSNFADSAIGCVAGELCLRIAGHDAGTKAVSGLYWRYEQGIRKCEAMVDSPVGVYGGFYAVRRNLVTTLPQGLILDDMYQPLCIVRRGFRSVVDDRARVWDTWPKNSGTEFDRKVRTLAGNYQLVQKARWLLGPSNRLRFQLISHKLIRLVVPFLLLFMLVSSLLLRATQPYTTLLVAQVLFYGVAALGLVWDTRLLRRFAAPASALVLLNAAAVLALAMFVLRPTSLLALWVKPEVSTEERVVRAA